MTIEHQLNDDIEGHLIVGDLAVFALKLIARGRKPNGKPMPGEDAQEIARKVLVALQEDWILP